ncbi:antitoxin VapB family protein [Candidatus Pacearchaeota archaeon]|nr:antitoxin VapB family protein [Candidatus Pacearchaeota archaeon]
MSKIITITDELYGKLKAMKKDDESFSKVIVRSINNKSNKNKVLELAGKRKDLDIDLRKIRKEWIWNRHV